MLLYPNTRALHAQFTLSQSQPLALSLSIHTLKRSSFHFQLTNTVDHETHTHVFLVPLCSRFSLYDLLILCLCCPLQPHTYTLTVWCSWEGFFFLGVTFNQSNPLSLSLWFRQPCGGNHTRPNTHDRCRKDENNLEDIKENPINTVQHIQ